MHFPSLMPQALMLERRARDWWTESVRRVSGRRSAPRIVRRVSDLFSSIFNSKPPKLPWIPPHQTLRIINIFNTQKFRLVKQPINMNQTTKGMLQFDQQRFNHCSSRTSMYINQSTVDFINWIKFHPHPTPKDLIYLKEITTNEILSMILTKSWFFRLSLSSLLFSPKP